MSDRVALLGLDVGTTTVRGLRLSARRIVNATTGAPEIAEPRVESRLPARLTPYVDGDLDLERLLELVDAWTGLAPADGGGVLFTGLAARAPSAARAAEALRARAGDGVVLATTDPRLEAWVAWMARAQALSRAHPESLVVNLDIGGGTTNVAWGRAGQVVATASLYVGARHVRLDTERRVAAATPEARQIAAALDVPLSRGERMPDAAAFTAWQVRALEELVLTGACTWPWLVQSAPNGIVETPARVTLSGGVGELAAALSSGGTAEFDDLGPELARALLASPLLAAGANAPDAGQATVWGLTLHSTTLSGATVLVPRPDLLPRRDVPIIASLTARDPDAAWTAALELARLSSAGGAVEVADLGLDADGVRALGLRLAAFLEGWPADRLLVLLLRVNVGLALGGYATGWGRRPAPLIVLDQIALQGARLITLGRPTGAHIPVSFSSLC